MFSLNNSILWRGVEASSTSNLMAVKTGAFAYRGSSCQPKTVIQSRRSSEDRNFQQDSQLWGKKQLLRPARQTPAKTSFRLLSCGHSLISLADTRKRNNVARQSSTSFILGCSSLCPVICDWRLR